MALTYQPDEVIINDVRECLLRFRFGFENAVIVIGYFPIEDKRFTCHWHHLTEEAKIEYLGYARAAIKAMREPTEKMTRVGGMFLPDYDPSDDDAKDCWQNMIDAVLND